MLPTEIHTARLLLRVPRLDDAPAVFARWAQDPEVTRFLRWRPHRAISETEAFLRDCEAASRDGTRFTWVITETETDAAVGMVDARPEGHAAEVGFVLARDCWSRGYMTEALRAVVEVALALPDLRRVWAACDVANGASARVMERAGLRCEGRLTRFLLLPNRGPEPRDAWCYARTR